MAKKISFKDIMCETFFFLADKSLMANGKSNPNWTEFSLSKVVIQIHFGQSNSI